MLLFFATGPEGKGGGQTAITADIPLPLRGQGPGYETIPRYQKGLNGQRTQPGE